MIDSLSRKEKIWAVIFFVLLILGIFLNSSFVNEFTAWQNNPFSSSRVNILLTGYDIDHHNISRTDTIMIASLDTSTRDFNIVSIPRDSKVEIPGRNRGRINSAYAYGGIDLTIETIENFLHIPIDYYINLDFQGFINIVDAMDGVELEIEDRMYYVDEAGDLFIDFSPGKKELDGEEALKYVRYRDPIRADIGRINRQQKFIKAALEQLLQPGMVTKMPEIVSESLDSVYTDINFSDIIPFGTLIMNVEVEEINTVKLPGAPETINGASYWIVDEEEKFRIVDKYLRGEKQRRYTEIDLNIYNGSGEAGAAGGIAEKLARYGFNIREVTNADNFDYKTTEVVYFQEKNEDIARRIGQYLEEAEVIFTEEKSDDIDSLIEITVGAGLIED